MPEPTSLAVELGGRAALLSLAKYRSGPLPNTPYHSTEIASDQLLLSETRTVADFKASVHAQRKSRSDLSRIKHADLLNQAAQQEFNAPYQAILKRQQDALRHRYQQACASNDREFRASELRVCAAQGHVQANLDLGALLSEEGDSECLDFLANAHNLGHPESLLCLAKTFLRADQQAAAIRVLLLGAWCESFRCAQVLLLLLDRSPDLFERPECIAALEESCTYGSMRAMYLLGFILRHGKSCRDETRGNALIRKAGAVRHPRPDGDKGAATAAGMSKPPAGTLAHFESRIDRELLAMNSKEMEAQFFAEAAKLARAGEQELRTGFDKLMIDLNPVPDRMVRRVGLWLAASEDEPVDEVKRERMRTLFGAQACEKKDGGHE